MRRLARWTLDTGPVLVLALIAGAGSFTHIRDTATDNGQSGWMAWAIAVSIDLTCVMAARERHRDKKTGRRPRGPVSWPIVVLTGGVVLSLAANLQQAEPTVWGWIIAATPAGTFLVAVSMLERRATANLDAPSTAPAETAPACAVAGPQRADPEPAGTGPAPALLDYARRVAEAHHAKSGNPITGEQLRTRLGVSHQLASDLLSSLRTAPS
jgi:hypothetical protein